MPSQFRGKKIHLIANRRIAVNQNERAAVQLTSPAMDAIADVPEQLLCAYLYIHLLGRTDQFLQPALMFIPGLRHGKYSLGF